MDDCPNCSQLQAQLSRLIAGLAGTLALITAELEEPTMNRHQLVLRTQERLSDTLNGAY